MQLNGRVPKSSTTTAKRKMYTDMAMCGHIITKRQRTSAKETQKSYQK